MLLSQRQLSEHHSANMNRLNPEGVRPLINCRHCGSVIGLRAWPPAGGVLSGPCPGCGGWLTLDLRSRGEPARPFPAAEPPARDAAAFARSAPGDRTTPVPRLRKSGSADPLFLPKLARQGKLLILDPPETPRLQGTPRTSPATTAPRRRWKRSAGMAACLSAAAGLTAMSWQAMRDQPERARPQPRLQELRLPAAGAPRAILQKETIAGPSRSLADRG